MTDTLLQPKTLAELIRHSREAERAMTVELTEEERRATGTPDSMSAKDLVAHVTAAKIRNAWKLDAASRGEPAPSFDDHENAQIFAENAHRPWEEVAEEADRVCEQLVVQVQSLTVGQLNSLQPDPCEGEKLLWRQLLYPFLWHPYGHLTGYYLGREDAVRATRLHQALVDVVRSLDAPGPLLGCVTYNLACVFAVTGRSSEALDLLGEALRLDPELVELSQHDGDLDSLRQDPKFSELFAA